MAQQKLKTGYLLLSADNVSTDISFRAYENYANAYDDMKSAFQNAKKQMGKCKAEISDYSACVHAEGSSDRHYWNIKKITV